MLPKDEFMLKNFFAKLRSSLRLRENNEKTYIVPTLYGVAYGVVCLLLFGIGFASTNNAVYFLCFFLVSLGSQSLVTTNRNTEKLHITHIAGEDFFADETGRIRLSVQNRGKEDLRQIQLSFSKKHSVDLDRLKVGEHREVLIPYSTPAPGILKIPDLRVSSDFPYHFARSWKKYFTDLSLYVYPARRGSSQFSKDAFVSRSQESQSFDDFKGHRDYQKTDSPRSIDWKVTARVQKTTVKEYDPQTSQKITLRWEDCPQATESDKRSQLSLWIDLAEKNSFDYSLELPHRVIPFSRGPQHRTDCLRALI